MTSIFVLLLGYVMKYFMQYRSEVAYVIDQSQQARTALLTAGDSPDLRYLISLVDLLATCAEVCITSPDRLLLLIDFEYREIWCRVRSQIFFMLFHRKSLALTTLS